MPLQGIDDRALREGWWLADMETAKGEANIGKQYYRRTSELRMESAIDTIARDTSFRKPLCDN
jgi:hypothetical protein